MPRKSPRLSFVDLPLEMEVIILQMAALHGGTFTTVALLFVCHSWYDMRSLWLPKKIEEQQRKQIGKKLRCFAMDERKGISHRLDKLL